MFPSQLRENVDVLNNMSYRSTVISTIGSGDQKAKG